jgi:DNA-binding IclR family transcriptional regulator
MAETKEAARSKSQESVERGGVSSSAITRIFGILSALIESARPMSSTEVALRTGIDPSTTHRLLQALVSEGYVLRDDNTKKYVAGPQVLFPLQPHHPFSAIRRDSVAPLIALRDETSLTAVFVVFYFGQRILIEFVPGRDPMSPTFNTWITTPIHASASGKLLLSMLPTSAREELLGKPPYEKHTEFTITGTAELSRELDAIAAKGYVLSYDEQILGLRSAAAPVRAPSNRIIGCFIVYGRGTSFRGDLLDRAGPAVKAAADIFSVSTPSLLKIDELTSLSL